MGIDCLGHQESYWENVDPLKKCLMNIKKPYGYFFRKDGSMHEN